MSALKDYIKFLQEYKQLLERGVTNILNDSNSKFIWINEINELISNGTCQSTLPHIFSDNQEQRSTILSITKPSLPEIIIPKEYGETIIFNEVKLGFESINNDEEELHKFSVSEDGEIEYNKLKAFTTHKNIYSRLFRAYNDIKNDSNQEIVLSVGLFQYARQIKGALSKTNQHLFHFPLTLELTSNSVINVSFSDSENPYDDFFFLNNTPIEKAELVKIINSFENQINQNGYKYIFENDFKNILEDALLRIANNTKFQNTLFKPESDFFREDWFKISFSPAINIKFKKPRAFEKLTKEIISHCDNNIVEAPLFNLLIRDPNSHLSNIDSKSNYFKDELFENYKSHINTLNKDEDFSIFFPLPFNTEQKKIYENYLGNKLTVVTGPPGTGKSHTIVNILCSLLAQGKKVLVTAQTDKALESLLDKIPETFDDLIFTKIKLETNQNRFSLERSIDNISRLLKEPQYLNLEALIQELDNLKEEYLSLKAQIIRTLEAEYSLISINDSFNDLRAYQVVEKFESKKSEEWNWIRDSLKHTDLNNFEEIRENILKYKDLSRTKFRYNQSLNKIILGIAETIECFDFEKHLSLQEKYYKLLNALEITANSDEKFLKIEIDDIIDLGNSFSNSDIILRDIKELEQLQKQIKPCSATENLTANKTFSDLSENAIKYLNDIETYLSFTEDGKAGFFTKHFNSYFKKVAYLEQFTINGRKCNSKSEIVQLKLLIENLLIINNNFNILIKAGFTLSFDDTSNLIEKYKVLSNTLKKIEVNKDALSKIQFNQSIIAFSEYSHISLFDIDTMTRKALLLKDSFYLAQNLFLELTQQREILKSIDISIKPFIIDYKLDTFYPVVTIDNIDKFNSFKISIKNILQQIRDEDSYLNLRDTLLDILPNTFDNLLNTPTEYILKENFEYANANFVLGDNEVLDLQKFKEGLSFINKNIFRVKCQILFDLAKTNFKGKFQQNEVEAFINLLENYKYNLSQSVRKIRNQTQFQNLVRQNSIDISKFLSCWVMKFNDVLDSIGHEPTVFDCIIVDEASQLDFNSLLLSYYAKSMIIVGDDKQTSPTNLTGVDGNDFEGIKNSYLQFLGDSRHQIKSDNSLFILAKGVAGTSNVTLREHFRCVPEIIEFSKVHFYNNSLRPLKQINSNRLPPKEAFFTQDAFTERKVVYKEISEIKAFLRRVLSNNQYVNKSIGVVSLGLADHTEKLKDIKEDLVHEFGKEKIDKHKLIIEDSPKFQGDERDVIIISLGVALDAEKLEKNENAKPRAIINDYDELKKINVALSRAKEQMILFHSINSEGLQSTDFRLKILSFFYDTVKPIPALQLPDIDILRTKNSTPRPFDSWFEIDVAKSLLENGYSYIQPQYQVKEDDYYFNPRTNRESKVHFKLDLVVHNNGKMVAIECDGDPFHSCPEDVAYDVERQEFLERIGWKVYRILYSAFRRNPQEEIDKIIKFIEKNTKRDFPSITPEPNVKKESISHNLPVEIITNDIINIQKDNNLSHQEIPHIEKSVLLNKPLDLFNPETKDVIYYLNLFQDGSYKLQLYSNPNCEFSLPIGANYKNGFLLQYYDNGCINKVYVKSILNKKIDFHYKNGKFADAKLIYLELIEKDTLISIKIKKGSNTLFKVHETANITNRDDLHLKGYKVVYLEDYSTIEYQILPSTIHKNIERLIFSSFQAQGKSIKNTEYGKEWQLILSHIPTLFD